jgi:hypothetical protein
LHPNPQPGGPGPRTDIPYEQGGLVITPGTGFLFHRLLLLAGLLYCSIGFEVMLPSACSFIVDVSLSCI